MADGATGLVTIASLATDSQGATGNNSVGATAGPGATASALTILAAEGTTVLHNSVEHFDTVYQIQAQGLKSGSVSYTSTCDAPTVVQCTLELGTGLLHLLPLARGSAQVQVHAGDGTAQIDRNFTFVVDQFQRHQAVASASPTTQAVALVNTANVDVPFTLKLDGGFLYPDMKDILQAVDAVQGLPAGASFGMKLWQFLMQQTVHDDPLTSDSWGHDPIVYLDSIGAGYCDDVASVYYQVAAAAGYQSRVWSLEGHVVPEIMLDGEWQMFDPDLGVYYESSPGKAYGVEYVAAHPEIIASGGSTVQSPLRPTHPYPAEIAGIYSSTDDNLVNDWYMQPFAPHDTQLVLPPGGYLVLPLEATATFTNYLGVPSASSAQMEMHLPAGWTGPLKLPLIVAEVAGSGVVSVENTQYVVEPGQPLQFGAAYAVSAGVQVMQNDGGLDVVLRVNPRNVHLDSSSALDLGGLHVGALQMLLVDLPAGMLAQSATNH